MKKMLLGLALLVALPLIAIVAYNQIDEQLDPKAAAWGEPRAATVPETDNGYYALIALGAPDGSDGMAYARAWVAEARVAAKENRNEHHAAVQRATRAPICEPAKASCLTAARDKGVELTAALATFQEDLARYQTLIAAKHYEEVLDYPLRWNASFPSYNEGLRAQRAWLTQAALAAEAGHLDAALTAIEHDLAFSRIMLGGTRTLLGKMIAVARYWADLAFLADLMQHKSAALAPWLPRLRAMLTAIDPAALRLDAAVETEFGMIKHGMLHLKTYASAAGEPDDSGIAMLFYQSNATVNLAFQQHMAIVEILHQPPASLKSAWSSFAQAQETMTLWDYLYNRTGKILIKIASPAWHRHPLRLHDLDAFNRLVTLRMEALAANVSAEQAAAFVATSPANLHDPYTGKPMVWNAAKHRYQFAPHATEPAQAECNVDADGAFVTL